MVRFIPCIPLQESWDRHFRPDGGRSSFPDRIFAGNSIRSCSDRRNFQNFLYCADHRAHSSALALIFLYPLNKKRVEENSKELARRRGEK